MLHKVSVETTMMPIDVVQRAYAEYRTPSEQETVYDIDRLLVFKPVVPVRQVAYVSDPSVEDWLKFQRLVRDWRTERGAMSSITRAALCPAYQSIIGMGPVAVPFIFAQLESEENEPDQWFWALKAILGYDPVRDEDRGNYVRMAESWLNWAKSEGYAW